MLTADERRACLVLFAISDKEAANLLASLDTVRLKHAFRQAVRRTHPDLFSHLPESERRQKTGAFIQAREAYRILEAFVTNRRTLRSYTSRFSGEAILRGAGTRRHLSDRPLRFGEFLVQSGVFSWGAVARAVAWQRDAAPRLGQIATGWNWATEAAIEAALSTRAKGERVGALLVRLGLLTPFCLKVLLRHQEKVRPPLGTYFLQQGLLSPERLRWYLQLQAAHNACCRLRSVRREA